MIPKIIHYCWLSSDPVPEDLQIYMKSWKEKLPDYEFIKWDFSKFGSELIFKFISRKVKTRFFVSAIWLKPDCDYDS